jgi:hypothetical protein
MGTVFLAERSGEGFSQVVALKRFAQATPIRGTRSVWPKSAVCLRGWSIPVSHD